MIILHHDKCYHSTSCYSSFLWPLVPVSGNGSIYERCSEGNFPWLFSMSEGDILLKCLIIGRQSCPESSLRKPQAVVGEGGQSGLLSVIIN